MSTAEIPKFPLIINGSRCKPASGEYMDVVNPATGEVVASAARGNTTDVDVAVAAAKAAFNNPQWRDMSPAERSKVGSWGFSVLKRHNTTQPPWFLVSRGVLT